MTASPTTDADGGTPGSGAGAKVDLQADRKADPKSDRKADSQADPLADAKVEAQADSIVDYAADSGADPSADSGADPTAELDLRGRLNHETAVIAWAELVRHFARGVVIKVERSVDLIDAAQCLAEDDADQLQAWINSTEVMRATDDDARDWTAREPDFWCVVTAPWVLVQELAAGDATGRNTLPNESKQP